MCILSPGFGLFFLFFYSHFRPWPPCQPQLPPLPWTTPMTTPNDDSRAEGDDNKYKGSRFSLRLEPWYVFFFYSFCFLYSFLFLFILISGHDCHVNHHHHHEWRQWRRQTMAAGQRETTMRMRARDTHCVSSLGMFFFLSKFFFSFFFSFFIHFRLCPPHSPQPPPPLPSWTAPMMMPNNDSRAEGDNDENEGSRCISSRALVCFLFSIVYLLI